MKRSEMIDKMVSTYATCRTMKYDLYKIMDRILEVCEENEMLPPPYDVVKNNPASFNDIQYMNKWESEN